MMKEGEVIEGRKHGVKHGFAFLGTRAEVV